MGGRYEVEALLGVGGMAEVVLARDSALGRRVALKLLAPALVADPMFVERFRREATAIAALSHANVVVVYEHGVAEGQPFIAMEYVPGRTVKQIITEGAPLPPAVAVNYACQALAGLEAAHATGIVHRDIKPQNLLVREDDTLKVADFGVARSAQDTVMTQHGSVIGTADYIAPEQAQGAPAVAASDLYSLGVVLFEMLTGRLPFTGELPLAVASQHALAPAPSVREFNPAVPDALARVVDRALSKTSAVRCQSAAEMKAALTAAMQGDPDATLVARARGADAASAATRVFPRTPGATARPGRARRSARVRALAALVALALLVAVVFAISTRGGGGSAAVRVPSVVGLPVATARSALEDDGFKVGIAPAQHAGEPAGNRRPRRPHRALGRTRRARHDHSELGPAQHPDPDAVRLLAAGRDGGTGTPRLRRRPRPVRGPRSARDGRRHGSAGWNSRTAAKLGDPRGLGRPGTPADSRSRQGERPEEQGQASRTRQAQGEVGWPSCSPTQPG